MAFVQDGTADFASPRWDGGMAFVQDGAADYASPRWDGGMAFVQDGAADFASPLAKGGRASASWRGDSFLHTDPLQGIPALRPWPRAQRPMNWPN